MSVSELLMFRVLDENKGTYTGGIIGGVVGGVLLLIIIVSIVVIFLLIRHRGVRIIPKFQLGNSFSSDLEKKFKKVMDILV